MQSKQGYTSLKLIGFTLDFGKAMALQRSSLYLEASSYALLF